MNVYLVNVFSLRILEEEIEKIIGESKNIIRMNMEEITIEDIISECSYYSLLDEQKYVIINNFKLNKENSKIEDYFKEPNPNTTLILIAESVDKRSVIYKTINTKGHVIQIDEIKDINNKINNYAKEKGIKIDYLAISELLENNLNNYDLALNEIDKIAIITNDITVDVVNKYTTKLISEDNFDFCDAIIKKDFKEIDRHLEEFVSIKGDSSRLIAFIALLASQYRIIYATKCLTGSSDQIAKQLNLHPYRVKLAKEKGYIYSKDEIQKKLLDLCDLDYQIKSSNIDRNILFKIFLINI